MDLSAGSMPSKAPPSTLSIRFCPECGQMDRFKILRASHYAYGKPCDGVIEVATYRLDSTTLTRNRDTDVGSEPMA